MTDRKNWRIRMVVKVTDEDGNVTIITPLERLEPSIDTPSEVVDSTEDQNLGYIHNPPKFRFNMTVKAIGDAVLKLTELQLNKKEFSIGTQVDNGSDDWSFYEEGLTLENCTIVSSSPGGINERGVSVANFSGMALGIAVNGQTFNTYPDV